MTRQFKYKDPKDAREYQYTTQFGIIIKREYPGFIEKKEAGRVLTRRIALNWDDYHDDATMNDLGQTAADRVKHEFWNLFDLSFDNAESVEEMDKVDDRADAVLENYGKKKVADMMYQLRIDAVKMHFEKKGDILDDSLARREELTYDEYLESRIPWFPEHAWDEMCRYWTSKEYEAKRKRGQACRSKGQEVAQNRGGSMPFGMAQQHMADSYGFENASVLDTYAAMKSGFKNLDEHDKPRGAIPLIAQKRIDNYLIAAKEVDPDLPDDWAPEEIDGELLYQSGGGMPHGQLPIADGAVCKDDIIYAGRQAKKSKTSVPLPSRQSHQLQRVIEENDELKVANQSLVQKQELHERLILELYKDMNEEPPAWFGTNLLPTPQGTPISSRVVSQGAQSNVGGDLDGLEVMAHKDGSANMVDKEGNHDLAAEHTDGNNSNSRLCGGTKGSNNSVPSPDK